jgi:hypothetical protein
MGVLETGLLKCKYISLQGGIECMNVAPYMCPARSLYLIWRLPLVSWRRPSRAFAYKDIEAARIMPHVPPIQPKGTIIDPEYPRTYALLIPVVRMNPT